MTVTAIPGGGYSEMFWWECAAGTLKPLTYTRPRSCRFCNPILDEMPKIPTLSQTSYFRTIHQKYNHTVLLMENHLSINNIVTISFIFSISEFPGNWYPILDQDSLISIPYPRPNCLKTIPFTAAHTYIGYIWEYPPGLQSFSIRQSCLSFAASIKLFVWLPFVAMQSKLVRGLFLGILK